MYDDTVINAIKDIMLDQHQTIAVAESVTAGHLQVALASAENASKFFQGGITAYNLGQKARHLQIEPIHAEHCNCVSEKVAAQMALNATRLFASDWGIATTGYAAPVPECSVEQPFAYYAICFHDELLSVKKVETKISEPIQVQVYFINKILKDFYSLTNRAGCQSSFSNKDFNSINSRFASAGPLSTSPSTE
jgi:PncC family amidohydrolase